MAADDRVPFCGEIHLFATGEQRRGLYRFFPPATRTELWAGLFLVVASLVGAVWVIKCRSEALALERDSVTVEGKVVRLWATKARKGWHHGVEYEYPASPAADSNVFRDRTELPQEPFGGLREGGPIAVKVCRTDPANHQVVGERPRVCSSAAAVLFCLGCLAMLALQGVINLWWWWVSSGKPGPGRVVVLGVKNVW